MLRHTYLLLGLLLLGCSGDPIAELEQNGVKLSRSLKGTVTTVRFEPDTANDDALSRLTRIPSVQEVYAQGGSVTDAGLGSLAKLAKVEVIALENSKITGSGIAEVAKVTTLKALDLSGNVDLVAASLEPLRGHAALEQLDLGNTAVTDATIEVITSIPRLNVLRLNGTKVTEAGIEQLSRGGQQLTELVLSSQDLTDSVIPQILKFDKMIRLEIADSGLSDAGLAQLVTLQNLSELYVPGNAAITNTGGLAMGSLPSLTKLDLSRTAVTAEGFNRAGFKLLQFLFLNNSKMTIEQLDDLQGLPELYALECKGNAITEAAVRKLYPSNHQTAVTWE